MINVFDQMSILPEQGQPRHISRYFVATWIVLPIAFAVHLFLYEIDETHTPPLVLAAVFGLILMILGIWRLWQVHERTRLRVDKLRLRYLIGVLSGAVMFAIAEHVARFVYPPTPSANLSISARAFELQGAVPPLSVLLAGLSVYFIYHILVNYRLLDLYEMFSRLATLILSALALVLVDGVTVMWVDTFTDYPFHSTFQVFLASILFLAAYDPLKGQIQWWSNRIFNRRGHQLAESLEALRREVPTITSKRVLADVILTRLHGSGRVPLCGVYLWNRQLNAYGVFSMRGDFDQEPLAAVATHPFTDGFTDGAPWYVRSDLVRRLRVHPKNLEVIGILDAIHADLVIPIRAADLVLGWLQLKDDDWSDGFSSEEIHRLQHVAYLASVVLSNIREFQQREEEHRLAALGAMAAGLAHEIRNPLAGIKGAAQYLQAEQLPTDCHEMLNVVVREADRLNVVVSQFLEYARPFKLDSGPDHINAMTSQVLSLLRAQGIPDNIQVHEDLAGDLPPIQMDRTRMSQVMINLLQNALQAMPDGGQLTIRTLRRKRRSGQYVLELAITDSGKGIEPEAMEKLFVPFFTTKERGTGLGLAISQRIVQAHGGELEARSRINRGSTFIVRLPMPIGFENSEPLEDEPTMETAL